MISVFELFSVGIGPSSSHSVGPMRAVRLFLQEALKLGLLPQAIRVHVVLYGSLALTGKGHGTDRAIVLGLSGQQPELINPDSMDDQLLVIDQQRKVRLLNQFSIEFHSERDIEFRRRERLPYHPNGMRFTLLGLEEQPLLSRIYYSIGGGFVVSEEQAAGDKLVADPIEVPFSFRTATELVAMCRDESCAISDIVMQNELRRRSEVEVRAQLVHLWNVMQDCVSRGCSREGTLPGGLQVRRRAAAIYRSLTQRPEANLRDPLTILDWVNLYALAVNEENAACGRVVTAPTNGAAGIVPAVMHYYDRFVPGANPDGIVRFLLTAGAIGILYKLNASISGAEVGCQGEVGVACSMAAGALTEVLGGSVAQVEQAAEIGMEHNLGLTCDPIGGLVQVPCIERNAMGAVKAINSARLALRGDGVHKVSLDKVIATMRRTGADMSTKYKETSRGGLAVNVTEC
ncbi:MAG: L-serine ammonia-lyase [Planctomycetales bacterium]|nr:L-serine ammonia-lyase [Planctomycetales bacterium]